MTTFKRNDNADTNLTSFHDVEVRGSLKQMIALLGEPTDGDGGYKTKHEWVMEGDDGTVVTVYDYKYNGAREEHWHVGGHRLRGVSEVRGLVPVADLRARVRASASGQAGTTFACLLRFHCEKAVPTEV